MLLISETETMNPDQLTMTLDSNADIEIEANVETGKGYVSAEVAEDDNKIIKEAIEWQLTRGSRSGRVAWQFIIFLAGKYEVLLKS